MTVSLIEIPAKLPDNLEDSNKLFIQCAQRYNQVAIENADLQHQLNQIRKYIFGQKRERFTPEPAAQLTLGDTAEMEDAKEVRKVRIAEYERKETAPVKHPGRLALPDHLPRKDIVIEPDEDQRKCCGAEKKRIGEEVTEELEFHPSSLFVNRYIRPKYACKCCGNGVTISKLPPRPIEQGRPGAGLLAHVLISKYGDHLPLYRQEQIFARQGIHLSRQTMMNWVKFCYEFLLPVHVAMKEQIRTCFIINSDDSPLKVLDRDHKNGSRLGYMWVYVGNYQQVVFDYRPGRSRAGPEEFLQGAKGYLQVDGYAGYNGIEWMDRVACMMHIRRYFHKALDTDPAIAGHILDLIRRIYQREREAKELGLSGEKRLDYRREYSLNTVGELLNYLKSLKGTVLPKSSIGRAVSYALDQFPYIVAPFQCDGSLEIDNGVSERAIRRLAIGRKNWIFAGSDDGGKWMAVMYSIIGSCKQLGLEPYAYLKWLIETVTGTEDESYSNLTPLACSNRGEFLIKNNIS